MLHFYFLVYNGKTWLFIRYIHKSEEIDTLVKDSAEKYVKECKLQNFDIFINHDAPEIAPFFDCTAEFIIFGETVFEELDNVLTLLNRNVCSAGVFSLNGKSSALCKYQTLVGLLETWKNAMFRFPNLLTDFYSTSL